MIYKAKIAATSSLRSISPPFIVGPDWDRINTGPNGAQPYCTQWRTDSHTWTLWATQTNKYTKEVGWGLADWCAWKLYGSLHGAREREQGRKTDGRLKKHRKGAAGEHGNRMLTCYLLISSNQCCTAPCQFREPGVCLPGGRGVCSVDI